MKTIILVITLLTLTLYSSVNANEIKCKGYDVPCKMKKFAEETKEYQKQEWNKAGEKLNKIQGKK
jgi:outer membrane protein assembly factor BamD (BamD/ComL family)